MDSKLQFYLTRELSYHVVGHGSSETIRALGFRVRRSCRRASYRPAGTLRRAGWLAAMRAMAIEWRWLQLATDASGDGLLL